MRRTGIYKKVGRRYEEIGEYDPEITDYIPNGVTVIVKRPGMTSHHYKVDPDIVPMLAAAKYCEDEISTAIMRGTEVSRPRAETPLTPGQKAAWEKLVEEFGDHARQLQWPSARDAAEAGTRALQAEAEKLLKNNSIREAYEHFQLLCKLSAAQDELSS